MKMLYSWANNLSLFIALHLIIPENAAAAKSLQLCPTLCDPTDGSPPGSPSLGFSRQEHWSGLPFPSPVHKSEERKWSRLVMSDPQWPHGLQPSRLLHPWDFPGKSTEVGCHCLLQPQKIILCISDLNKWFNSFTQSPSQKHGSYLRHIGIYRRLHSQAQSSLFNSS